MFYESPAFQPPAELINPVVACLILFSHSPTMTARLENVQFDGNASCFPHGIEFKVLACATGSSLATAANMGAASEGTSVRARMQYRLKGAGNEAVIDENILLDAQLCKTAVEITEYALGVYGADRAAKSG
jgi:hypothetical protein